MFVRFSGETVALSSISVKYCAKLVNQPLSVELSGDVAPGGPAVAKSAKRLKRKQEIPHGQSHPHP
jgi:hypothetical protein